MEVEVKAAHSREILSDGNRTMAVIEDGIVIRAHTGVVEARAT